MNWLQTVGVVFFNFFKKSKLKINCYTKGKVKCELIFKNKRLSELLQTVCEISDMFMVVLYFLVEVCSS